MRGPDSAHYRLRLAQGFLEEAREDVSLKRWRSAVDNAQLAVENAAKAVLALLGPIGRTHHPAPLLRDAVQRGQIPSRLHSHVERIAELSELLGFDVHVQTDYGDEMGGRTPWELFDKTDAQSALEMAEQAVSLAQQVIQDILRSG